MDRFGMRTTSARTKRRRKPRRSSFKKQHPQTPRKEISTDSPPSWSSTSFNDSSKMEDIGFEAIDDEVISTSTLICTPKAPRFRIPEISGCPPAPKKARRVLSDCSILHRSQIAFFAQPDLELLFFSTLQDMSV